MLLNGTLNSLKVFLMYLGGNRRWVPLITVYWKADQYPGIWKILECSIRYQYSVILKYRYVLFRQIWFGIGTPFKIAFTFYFIAGESELLIKKKTLSLIASMRLFYHRYLIIVNCNSVSLGVLSMLVLLLMSGPVLPTHRDPKVKEEGLVASGADGQGREGWWEVQKREKWIEGCGGTQITLH